MSLLVDQASAGGRSLTQLLLDITTTTLGGHQHHAAKLTRGPDTVNDVQSHIATLRTNRHGLPWAQASPSDSHSTSSDNQPEGQRPKSPERLRSRSYRNLGKSLKIGHLRLDEDPGATTSRNPVAVFIGTDLFRTPLKNGGAVIGVNRRISKIGSALQTLHNYLVLPIGFLFKRGINARRGALCKQ
jgi:hypothetical protein